MSSLLAFTENRETLIEKYRKYSPTNQGQNDAFPFYIFEWNDKATEGSEYDLDSMNKFKRLNSVPVRVVFIPRDIPHPACASSLTEIFDHCEIPTGFISESLQQVSQSFGSQVDDEDTTHIWFHFLTKDISTEEEDGQWRVVHPEATRKIRDRINDEKVEDYQDDIHKKAHKQSQANFAWTKTGVVLRVKKAKQSSSCSSKSAPKSASYAGVTMYCFGAPNTFLGRFQTLRNMASCEDMLRDPYVLICIVMEEMYELLDGAGWWVARSFGLVETKTLQLAAENLVEARKKPDFTGLHNLAKHIIYLQENCESALATIKYFRDFYVGTIKSEQNLMQQAVQDAIDRRRTLFESTGRRLSSLDRRVMNIIELSFNLVTLSDSRTMESENKSMKTIAIMTLFFMPIGTVAGVFGTEFFHLADDAPFRIQVSRDIWKLWVIAGSITTIVVFLWRWWSWITREKLTGESPGHGGRHIYQGMKKLRHFLVVRSTDGDRRGKLQDQGIPLANMTGRC